MQFKEFRRMLYPKECCTRNQARVYYKEYVIMSKQPCVEFPCVNGSLADRISGTYGFTTVGVCPEMIGVKPLAPCTKPEPPSFMEQYYSKQEGINPMLNTKTNATNLEFNLNAEMPKSEAATQREYLLGRLEGLKHRYDEVPHKLRADFRKAFNLDAKDLPTDPEEFMKLLKKGDISLDQKRIDKLKARAETYEDDCYCEDMLDDEGKPDIYRYYSLTSFLVWKDAPKADPKGYTAAIEAWQKDFQATRDIIMVSSAADGLEALQKMEAWTLKGSKSTH